MQVHRRQAYCDSHSPPLPPLPCPQVTYQTSHGQLLDLVTAPQGTMDLSRYTMDNYMRIVTYKTAFYTFYLPVACGMVLAGVTSPEALALANNVCIEMGRYFQVMLGAAPAELRCISGPSPIRVWLAPTGRSPEAQRKLELATVQVDILFVYLFVYCYICPAKKLV